MHRSLIALATLLVAVAGFAAPVRKPSARPADNSTQASQLADQLTSLEKALPEAQKKHDHDFYNRTLTDDFISIGKSLTLQAVGGEDEPEAADPKCGFHLQPPLLHRHAIQAVLA